MKTILSTIAAETPGLFRVAILHRPEGALAGGVVVAYLMRGGSFAMPRSPEQAKRIAELPRDKAEAALDRAASVLQYAAF